MAGFWYYNGEFVDPAAVHIDAADAGFLQGDGVFETLRVQDRHARDFAAHFERLEQGLGVLDIDVPETIDDWRRVVDRLVAPVAEVSRLRLTISRGPSGARPTRLATVTSYDPPPGRCYLDGVDAMHSSWTLPGGAGTAFVKSISWQRQAMALRDARKAGCFEALLSNDLGQIVEGSRTNVLVRLDGAWITPTLSSGCLAGTVRRRLLESGAVAEGEVVRDMIDTAPEILLTNSLIGVLPLASFAGRRLRVGAAAERLARYLETTW